jgi:hypothetical protein
MKTKDTIAFWVLVLFILVPTGLALQALDFNQPTSGIVWHIVKAIILTSGGLFLISRFITVTNDLEYYEQQDKQRNLDAIPAAEDT